MSMTPCFYRLFQWVIAVGPPVTRRPLSVIERRKNTVAVVSSSFHTSFEFWPLRFPYAWSPTRAWRPPAIPVRGLRLCDVPLRLGLRSHGDRSGTVTERLCPCMAELPALRPDPVDASSVTNMSTQHPGDSPQYAEARRQGRWNLRCCRSC